MLDKKKYDVEAAKKRFSKHIATFSDFGNIKVLDFSEPGTNTYRIRFLFEEDYYRLHISGDFGELTACNCHNMCFEKFEEHYAKNLGYFKSKVVCHSQNFDYFNHKDAEKELRAFLISKGYFTDSEEELNEAVDEIMQYFDEERCLEGYYECLMPYTTDSYEAYLLSKSFGKASTGYLELYLLAFELAFTQLTNKNHLKKGLLKMENIKYYEVEIPVKGCDDSYCMAIKADHVPEHAELQEFLATDIAMYGGTGAILIGEISIEDAMKFYDFEGIDPPVLTLRRKD